MEGRSLETEDGEDAGRFLGGRVVAESPDAEHHSTRLTLEFAPKDGLEYFVFYKVGGGGGHELRVSEALLYQTIHDDADAVLSTTYRSLVESKMLGNGSAFAIEMTIAAARSLVTQITDDKPLDGSLTAAFASIGISIDQDHMKAVEVILSQPVTESPVGGLQLDNSRHEQLGYHPSPGPIGYDWMDEEDDED